MKKLLYVLILIVSILTVISCDNNTIAAYDDFNEEFDTGFTNSPQIPPTQGESFQCGYSLNGRWARLSKHWAYNGWYCNLDPNLVSISNTHLNLDVPGLDRKGAQIETIRNDYWYGSYRAKFRTGVHSGSITQGSCNAFFLYHSDPQEIDVEILTQDQIPGQQYTVHFVTQPERDSTYLLPWDPASTYIEYGFDWYVDKVDFFVNGKKVKTQFQNSMHTVPYEPGKIVLVHWTGNPNWSGIPPPQASNMSTDYVTHVPFLLVTNPNAKGMIWSKGTSRTIAWEKCGDVSIHYVRIELWKNGSPYMIIDGNAPNTGSYTWFIPFSLRSATSYQIKIMSQLSKNYFDFSNYGFTIQ